jgi:hypothetical protein
MPHAFSASEPRSDPEGEGCIRHGAAQLGAVEERGKQHRRGKQRGKPCKDAAGAWPPQAGRHDVNLASNGRGHILET